VTVAVTDADIRFAPAMRLADAVLYEGYVLYPYRASARKNQIRWQFGVLAPQPFSVGDGWERYAMQTECVAEVGAAGAVLDVRVRGLQVQSREIDKAAGASWQPVPQLEVDGRLWAAWDEAVEREIEVPGVAIAVGGRREERVTVELPGGTDCEALATASGGVYGRIRRRRWPVRCRATVTATPVDGPYPLVKLSVTVENLTEWRGDGAPRDEVVRHCLVGAHTLLAIKGGGFVSQLDPPEFAASAVAGCHSAGTFPVLAGPPGRRDLVLSSPIILYDHAEVAPESPGGFCDATEIDEILALRVMTLTEDEKREARATDPRAAAIVDRCDTIPDEVLGRLHGAVRSLRQAGAVAEPETVAPWWDPKVDASVDPWHDTVTIGGAAVAKGSRVRLCPGRRADAHDLFLAGRAATVQAVFVDVDGDHHLAVTLDDDPGADLYETQGRFLYFHPDEVEPIESQS
jgi:hypothetical protein